jgi:hypothetical protein
MLHFKGFLPLGALVCLLALGCDEADDPPQADASRSDSMVARDVGSRSDAMSRDRGTGGPDATDSPDATDTPDARGQADTGSHDAATDRGVRDLGAGQGPPLVSLAAAGGFVILAKTAISSVPESAITGDVGLSPAAASFITGFSLVADATNVFATATQVVGRLYAADYAPPTPANLTAAVSAMELAYADAAGRPADVTELGAGNIGGLTLAPGVYQWGTGLLIPTDVFLDGHSTDTWIFQVAGDLTMGSGVRVLLNGSVLPGRVFWQVAGSVDLGTTAHLEGVVLGQTSIRLRTGASVRGRLLAQSMVNIEAGTVVQP